VNAMSLTAYDGQFSFRQNELATKGDQGPRGMTAEQYEKFKDSPFMQKAHMQEDRTWSLTGERDRKRKERDNSFRPCDGDFDAPKAYDYDKWVNYYQVLGVDDYAAQDEIKKAYKKLSLIYHPDKSHGLTPEEQEEYAGVFIELKNAYLTLSDPPTRRQYDRDRDHMTAGEQICGFKKKMDKASFDATAVLQKLKELQKPPGKVKVVKVPCKIEKFFYGGPKHYAKARRVLQDGAEHWEDKTFRIDVPKGATDGWECQMKGGDMNWETQPDQMKFITTTKVHQTVERRGQDLFLKRPIMLRPDAPLQPYLTTELSTIAGRSILLWGRNPIYHESGAGRAQINVGIAGEGIGAGSLRFGLQVETPKIGTYDSVVVSVKCAPGAAEFACAVPIQATVSDLHASIREILQWPEDKPVVLMRPHFHGPAARLGSVREVVLQEALEEVPMSIRRARELLTTVAALASTEEFCKALQRCNSWRNLEDHERVVRETWQEVAYMALVHGYRNNLDGLKAAVSRALWRVGAEPDGEAMRQRFAGLGFRPQQPGEPEDGDDPMLAQPFAESAVQPRRSHGTIAAAAHPEMLKRIKRRESKATTYDIQLSSLFGQEGLQLYTKPPCYVYFYSNHQQVSTARLGGRTSSTMFAIAISCPAGAKRACKAEWMRLRHRLLPMLKQGMFLFLRETMNILPKSLPAEPVFDEKVYTYAEGAKEIKFDEDTDQAQEDSGGINEQELIALAKQRVQDEAGPEEDIDFDDLDVLDLIEEAAQKIRQDLKNRKQKSSAAREVWQRDAEQQAKWSEYMKAAEVRALEMNGSAVPKVETSAASLKQMAIAAFQQGEFFTAQHFFARELEKLPEDDLEKRGIVHSNRAACFARVRDFVAALEEARTATELRPTWGRAWNRLASAATSAHGLESEDARSAWSKAVVHEANDENVEGLAQAYASERASNAHARKERGNVSARAQEWGEAVAQYTIALASLPSGPFDTGEHDEFELLRALLYTNRSAAFARLRRWESACEDGRRAADSKPDYAKAHVRYGAALLGCRLYEQAYTSFAKALMHDDKDKLARKGREVCLGLIPRWESKRAVRRRQRFLRDMNRPAGQTKVYTMSDLHFDQPKNEEWAHSIHSAKFQDDVLIVAGNVADSFRALERALSTLRAKFRRVFYVPGNHEMWINRSETARFPDSLSKLWSIIELCDDLDVDIFPAAVCQGVYIVPLLSWYNSMFDIKDPFPSPEAEMNKHAKWPIDAEQQVWRYMLRLNQASLNKPYHGTVITCSHFAPNGSCPILAGSGMRKTAGCLELDEQLRSIRSCCHVYGHTRVRYNGFTEDVRYVNRAVYVDTEADGSMSRDPITCIYNGNDLCFTITDI